jgi:hypothetical protein
MPLGNSLFRSTAGRAREGKIQLEVKRKCFWSTVQPILRSLLQIVLEPTAASEVYH